MAEFSEYKTIELGPGRIRYREIGSGPPVVALHGLFAGGTLWDATAKVLAARGFRVYVPELPLGAHTIEMENDADLSPAGLARLVAEFIEKLGLKDVTLVGNDSGGAIAQITAANHPQAIARLALANCDTYKEFLPIAFRYLQGAARIPGATMLLSQGMRLGFIRQLPIAFGALSKTPIPEAMLDQWLKPLIGNSRIRRDVNKAIRGISNRYTIEAAAKLGEHATPLLIAWGTDDKFFSAKNAKRLAAEVPGARLEWIPDAAAFVTIDQPQRLGELIADFASGAKATA